MDALTICMLVEIVSSFPRPDQARQTFKPDQDQNVDALMKNASKN